jgi:hypothetical protein
MHNLSLEDQRYDNDHLKLQKTPTIMHHGCHLVHTWFQTNTSYCNPWGLWYARIDPIQLIGPQSIVWTTHVCQLQRTCKILCLCIHEQNQLRKLLIYFSKKAIVSIVLKTMMGIKHIRSLPKIHSRKWSLYGIMSIPTMHLQLVSKSIIFLL